MLNCRFIDKKIASMRVFYDHDTNRRLIANLRKSIAGGTRPTAMLERLRRAPADFGPLVGGFDTAQAEEAACELADLFELSASLQECALSWSALCAVTRPCDGKSDCADPRQAAREIARALEMERLHHDVA